MLESEWWGTCQNTLGEETKQVVYAKRMGLELFHDTKSPYNIDMEGLSVLDIGGGPVSLLLKCHNLKKGRVVDPLSPPPWVLGRYALAGIGYHMIPAEKMNESGWDEVWIYNCLQHTNNPQKVVGNARGAGKLIRLFEWIDTSTNENHPHSLSEAELNKWLGGEGKIEELKGEANCYGRCYYGVFPTV